MLDKLSRTGLLGLTGAFVALVFAYCAIWTWAAHSRAPVDVGLTLEEGTFQVLAVSPGGPAERAGLKPYDKIIAVDGDLVTRELELHDSLRGHRPGDFVQITVLLAALNTPRTFELELGDPPPRTVGSWVGFVGNELLHLFPLTLLAIAGAILYRRPDSMDAWLAALVATGMIGAVPLLPYLERIPPGLRGEVVGLKILFAGLGPAFLFSYYLMVPPNPSSAQERITLMRSASIGGTATVAGMLALIGWITEADGLARGAWPSLGSWTLAICWLAAVVLGSVALAEKGRMANGKETQSGIRVLEGGLAAALSSLLILALARWWSGRPLAELSGWSLLLPAVLLLALPASLGYVATARRVLDLPVLARRTVRHLLVDRGATAVVWSIAAMTSLVVADQVARSLSRGRWGTAFGILAGVLVGGPMVHFGTWLHRRLRTAIDRILFPRTHRTRRILEELAERMADVPSREDLAAMLEEGLGNALKPSFVAIYSRRETDHLLLEHGRAPGDVETIPLDQPIREEAETGGSLTVGSLRDVRQVGSDCLVPIRGREAGLLGLLALGPRGDGEPYSREEERLLLSVADRAARALDGDGPDA